MKGFVGTLQLKFTAQARSRRDLMRKCERVAARAESEVGSETWAIRDLKQLPAAIPLGKFAVHLCVLPPQRKFAVWPAARDSWEVVCTIAEAREVVREFLERHRMIISEQCWGNASGLVMDHQGEIVAKIGFDLAVSSPATANTR